MFVERLERIARSVGGAGLVSLVAADGIPVESHSTLEVEDLDVEALAAELLAQVHTIGENHRDFEMGAVEQFSVTTDRYSALLGRLNADYFLLLVLAAGSGLGRARFELRRATLAFEDDL
ncbi:MAG: hypothetical protein OES47_14210 [Acidobacteriota bacterium]|nr:hypothetical protein [Acidobacteriota bacterium]